ncbi:MAG: transcriptional regulator, TraR/DksA family [bacterium]|nr:transcriptional regulator, TraR/DksA family [bacterium]
MLNESQKGQLRTALETERARLVENARDGLQLSMNRERNIGRDSIDESMEEELFSTELRLRDREKFLLGKIDEALRRLDDNSVDECEDCGESIGFKRLLARPVTTYCIDCKEEREKEEQSQAQQSGRSGGVSREDIGGDTEITGGTEE